MDINNASKSKQQLNFNLDMRLVVGALLIIIATMLAMWRPWEGASDRTIQVSGTSTVTATPDEFVFYPTYEFKNNDKAAALDALGQKSEEIVAKLKELGLSDAKIKTNSNGFDYPYYGEDKTPTYSLQITATVDNKELAQKVQDYLVTTTPSGSVSPQATFSEAKQKELENQAREKATQDARSKAEQSAKNLGFSLGSVKAVDDGSGFGGISYMSDGASMPNATTRELTVQPGENELTYSVTVTYFVR